jgi:probable rRNA maturation factor
MARVYVGYNEFGVEQVDDEFIQFIFDVAVSMTKLSSDSEAGLIITSDEEIKKLNSKYRGKDKTTNVLSFAYLETTTKDFVQPGDENYIGDVYISRERLVDEAKNLKISEKERFVQLFVHGLLHLAGLDHEGDKEAEAMENLEDRIVSQVLE